MAKHKKAAPAKRGGVRAGAQQGRKAEKGAAAEPGDAAATGARKGPADKGAAGSVVTSKPELALPDAQPPIGLQNLGNTCFFNSALQVCGFVASFHCGGADTLDLGVRMKWPCRKVDLGRSIAQCSCMIIAGTRNSSTGCCQYAPVDGRLLHQSCVVCACTPTATLARLPGRSPAPTSSQSVP